ncbi:hypothetical protein [uncultured Helicobacter sp.]|uniref:hypothetical protein n=1 Tax=uncultured Helicobacter sp. TaxID=175537 RepID=UPI00262AB61B|nr:hypothetical protein [uncultured Helicobacter sp.]
MPAVEETAVAEPKKRIDWEKATNAERLENVNKGKVAIISHAMYATRDKLFLNQPMTQDKMDKTIPYDVATGKPFMGLNNALLRTFANGNGYKSNDFIEIKDAWKLGGELKSYKGITKEGEPYDKKPPCYRLEYMATWELRDKIDPKTNKPMTAVSEKTGRTYVVKERVDLPEPKLQTKSLYHISEFKGLDKSQFKERDMNAIKNYREKLANGIANGLPNLQRIGIEGVVADSLMRFINAQNKGQEYTPTQAHINMINKAQFQTQEKAQEKENQGRGR